MAFAAGCAFAHRVLDGLFIAGGSDRGYFGPGGSQQVVT